MGKFAGNVAHSSGIGFFSYPMQNPTNQRTAGYENTVVYRCTKGIHVKNTAHRGAMNIVGFTGIHNVNHVTAHIPASKISVRRSHLINCEGSRSAESGEGKGKRGTRFKLQTIASGSSSEIVSSPGPFSWPSTCPCATADFWLWLDAVVVLTAALDCCCCCSSCCCWEQSLHDRMTVRIPKKMASAASTITRRSHARLSSPSFCLKPRRDFAVDDCESTFTPVDSASPVLASVGTFGRCGGTNN